MRPFSFSLTSLLGVITLLALDFGAIAADSSLASSAAYTVFLGLLCFSVAVSILSPAEKRGFWVGFVSFGLVYWLAVFEAPGSNFRGATGQPGWNVTAPQPTGSNSVVSSLLDWIESRLGSRRDVGAHVFCRWQGGGYYWGTVLEIGEDGRYLIKWDDGSTPTWQTRADLASYSAHRRIALHCTAGAVWALLGGALVAFWLARNSKRPSQEIATKNEPPASDRKVETSA